MEKVECTECEWSGFEDDLHYKKLKPWATSEDAICPNCGASVIYEEPLPEKTTSVNAYYEKITDFCYADDPCDYHKKIEDNINKSLKN